MENQRAITWIDAVFKICTVKAHIPKFESQLCHFLAVRLWLSILTSISNGNEGCISLIGFLQELRISHVVPSTDYASSYYWRAFFFSLFILIQRKPL